MTDDARAGFVDPTREDFARFREMDRPGPVHMLNLLRFRARAAYEDGTIATGAEAYSNYARESGPVFKRLGGRQVWAGKPELMLIGPQSEAWDLAFIAEYPSPDAFVAMLRDPEPSETLGQSTEDILSELTELDAGQIARAAGR